MENENSPKAKGGIARAEVLTAEERTEIAKRAANARWNSGIIRATHTGELRIGETVIPCAVLEDGTRVLSERGVTKALGGKRGGAHWRRKKKADSDGAYLPVYISANNLKPFIDNDLELALTQPIIYRGQKGGAVGNGVKADILPQICTVWLKARDAKALVSSQEKIAYAADMLIRGLAHVGIIALVDEATGYQEVRDRLALEAILDKFLRKELAAWAKRFPDEFYQQIFRLKNWQWDGMSVKRPGVVGKYTTDLVYERLAPGIVAELEKLNPKNDRGHRVHRHHQWLTEDIGHPALAQHLYALIGFMRVSSDWEQFYRLVQRAFPKKNTTMLLPIPDPGLS